MGRVLGVDYGQKRIGFALSDPDRIIASPHDMVVCSNDKEAVAAAEKIIEEQSVDLVVVGLPLNMDGSRGPSAEAADKFATALRNKSGIPVEMWDERLTTKTAEAVLIEGGTRREKRKGLIDKIAAQIMLQSYLDLKSMPPLPDMEV